ncbi:unnamed protein product [Prorocentrum cordatum]|uniref:AMP-dependent synthetase/ligase domain-containing protein n=1 Tax=Prorocentrum cordatum TaxID=2364126 RepID=A0ABN9TCL9_9DINO|nr:unnamed protein product [Polarella glacialis]
MSGHRSLLICSPAAVSCLIVVLLLSHPARRLVVKIKRWIHACFSIGVRPLCFHLSSMRRLQQCSRCGKVFLPWELFYQCGRCERVQFCSTCKDLQPNAGHDHGLYREVQPLVVDTAILVTARCTSEATALALELYGPRPCLGTRVSTNASGEATLSQDYMWTSYSEVACTVGRFCSGLSEALGDHLRSRGDLMMGVLASVSLQWFVVDFACTLKCIPLVIMHRATSEKQLAHILDESGLTALVASEHLSELVLHAVKLTQSSNLQHIIWIDDMASAYELQTKRLLIRAAAKQSFAPGVPVLQHSWNTVLGHSAGAHANVQPSFVFANSETLLKLLPSSGSTGLPKLVAITEGASFKVGSCSRFQCSVEVVAYAYEAIRQTHDVLLQGGRIGVFSGSLDNMLDDVQRLRPTAFAAAPTFWNSLYSQFEQDVIEHQRQLQSDGASSCVHRGEILQDWMDRKVLGNRIVALISTGAPLRHEVQRWLVRVFGRVVINAYGTTETGCLSSNDSIRDGVELRLRDVPEMGYMTSDRPHPRGEILARTSRMTYFRPGDLRKDGIVAASVNTDPSAWITIGGVRYFRTGDVGELVAPGQVKVIDRCNNHFKLAQGIYVSPEVVEDIFMTCKFVRQVFVWGCSLMQSLVAVVVPSRALLMELGHHTTCAQFSDLKDANLLQQAQRLVLGSLQQLCREHGLKPWETPQIILLECRPFSMEAGLLTSSGKLCRAALIQRYRHRIEDQWCRGAAICHPVPRARSWRSLRRPARSFARVCSSAAGFGRRQDLVAGLRLSRVCPPLCTPLREIRLGSSSWNSLHAGHVSRAGAR